MSNDYFSVTSNPQFSQFIATSRYARWLDDSRRRETWEESVDRYICYFKEKLSLHDDVAEQLRNSILTLKVMPSMRALMTAGKALDTSHIAGYNCSYVVVDHPRAFDEAMFILMCGTGVGFSVERQYITKLPEIAEEFHNTDSTIKVGDSKRGWAKALRELIAMLYTGYVPKWDLTDVRPAGAKLKTFGGRASGPEPLDALFKFISDIFRKAKGRKLNSLECHDIMCKIGEVVVVGGVRRSALISLSNLSDERMRDAKKGQFWLSDPHRSIANNSVCYTEKPEFQQFTKEWLALYESKVGERGIFNRVSAKLQAEKTSRRDASYEFGVNPCAEILLRPNEFCNLTEVVIRPDDTRETLIHKVEHAAILGTMQATLTDFPYLRSIWKRNAEEEALLGVSLTGIMDHDVTSGRQGEDALISLLSELKQHAIETNKKWAGFFGINPAAAVTTVKPSGTVSSLVDCSSGIHDRFASTYIRRVRGDKKDPMTQFLKDSGVPCEDDIVNPSNCVFSFPIKSVSNENGKDSRSAIKQLEHWKIYKEHWAEHSVSVTIYYDDDEFLGVGQWVWDNWDAISGISFLPRTDHAYQQAPYEEITDDKYEQLINKMPSIDWAQLSKYETNDTTISSQTLACTGSVCEIVDIGG